MVKNVGTVNAGVIQAPAMNGNPVFTMDAAGIASGGVFLQSELEKRDTLIRKPLTSFTYPRDININVGGGWVDYISANSVQYGITGGSGNGTVQAGGSNGLPIVQASMDKGLFKAHNFAVALRIMFIDMQKSNFIGRSLDQLLSEGVRLAYDKHMDENVYIGLTDYGTTGLINNADATQTTAATGAGGTTEWSTKTPDEILADINKAIIDAWTAAEYDLDAIPNHILIPYEQYNALVTTMVTSLAGKSILDYLLENNIARKNGRDLFIGATQWCKGIGTGSTDRMVVYVNHERFVNVDELVPLARVMTAPNPSNFCYDTDYAANISETQIFYPETIQYVDGI